MSHRTCGCAPNMKCWRWLRQIAHDESRALRLLVAAHGRIPRLGPVNWNAFGAEDAA